MKLADAIRTNAPSLAAAQTTYKTDVVDVNTLVNHVLSSKLPALRTTPPDWAAFVTAEEQAKAAAMGWVNNVLARLLDVPDEVVGYNGIITQLLVDAQAQAQALATDPSNATALEILDRDLSGLTSQLGLVTAFIAGAVTNIQSFKDQMPRMAAQLKSIADRSIVDANADKADIQQLNKQLDNLRADIKSLTAAIVALGIADAAAITLGTVATIAAWPFGALVWLVMGPAVAAATTMIALDAKKIVADKAAIEAAQAQIKELDAEVATLSVLANSYGALASSATSLESSLQSILSEWQSLESEVTQAVSEIQSATASAGTHQFGTIAGELAGAVEAWNDASAQAGALHVELVVNDAALTLGMSGDEVSSALAGGQVVDVVTYYNRITS